MTPEEREELRAFVGLAKVVLKNCGTGAGGFTVGNSCGGGSSRRTTRATQRKRSRGIGSGVGARTRSHRRRRRGHARQSRLAHEARHAPTAPFGSSPEHREHHQLSKEHAKSRRDFARDLKADRADLRKEHAKAKREVVHDIKGERKEQRREHAKERGRLKKEQAKEQSKLDARHTRERERHGDTPAVQERQHAEREELTQAHRGERRDLREGQRADRESLREDHRNRLHEIDDEHLTERSNQHQAHRDEIANLRQQHRDEIAELHNEHRYRQREEDDEEKAIGFKAVDADESAAFTRLGNATAGLMEALKSAGIPGNFATPRPNTLSGKSGSGCGTGAGGFQPGNHCQTGAHSGGASAPSKARKKPGKPTAKKKNRAKKVGGRVHSYATAREREVAKGTGGQHVGDHTPMDVLVPRKGSSGQHCLEVKTMTFGAKDHITMHADAKLRKVEHAEAHPDDRFHTVLIDHRDRYEGGKRGQNYSGHDLYYKRGASDYKVREMHKVKDMDELKRLIHTPDDQLPAAARGSLPTGEALTKLRAQAEHDSQQRKTRDKARKTRQRDERRAERERAQAEA